MSYRQRVTQRMKYGWPTRMHRQPQLLNDCVHLTSLFSVGKSEFIKLPTIFMILQPQE
ncbi:hypothetical protein K883_02561 [Mycobacterium sp. TKK-01-0059]|nr:hypothetical protein K883_02561 [Mycobacterium sp. TKK-01-0059]